MERWNKKRKKISKFNFRIENPTLRKPFYRICITASSSSAPKTEYDIENVVLYLLLLFFCFHYSVVNCLWGCCGCTLLTIICMSDVNRNIQIPFSKLKMYIFLECFRFIFVLLVLVAHYLFINAIDYISFKIIRSFCPFYGPNLEIDLRLQFLFSISFNFFLSNKKDYRLNSFLSNSTHAVFFAGATHLRVVKFANE